MELNALSVVVQILLIPVTITIGSVIVVAIILQLWTCNIKEMYFTIIMYLQH